MARIQSYVWTEGNLSGICLLQTGTTSTNLLFNGPQSQQVYPWNPSASLSGFQRTIALTSQNDLSGQTVTLLGMTWSGLAVSEALAGPNNNTVSTTTQFMTLTSVAGSGTLTGISVGWGAVGQSRPYTVNSFNSPAALRMQVSVSGTMTYSARSTLDNIQVSGLKTWVPHPALVGTATAQDTYSSPPAAVQIAVLASTVTGAAMTFRINPTGV